jgi:hypothetical protein
VLFFSFAFFLSSVSFLSSFVIPVHSFLFHCISSFTVPFLFSLSLSFIHARSIPFISVTYDVRVDSKEEMNQLETKISSTISDSAAFTNEMQKTMKANDVKSVSPASIIADTTAPPKSAGMVGRQDPSSDVNGEKKEDDKDGNSSVLVGIVLGIVGALCVAGLVGAFVRFRNRKADGDQDGDQDGVELKSKRPSTDMTAQGEANTETYHQNPMNNVHQSGGRSSHHDRTTTIEIGAEKMAEASAVMPSLPVATVAVAEVLLKVAPPMPSSPAVEAEMKSQDKPPREQLKELKTLLEDGLITQDQFTTKQQAIVAKM